VLQGRAQMLRKSLAARHWPVWTRVSIFTALRYDLRRVGGHAPAS